MSHSTISLFLFVFFIVLDLSSSSFAANNTDATVYQSFLQCLQSNSNPNDKITNLIVTKTNQNYTTVLQNYIRNARLKKPTTPKPVIILTPKQVSHVQSFVICTKKVGYQLKVRSGGHDYEGISYVSNSPFFILDMSNIRAVNVDLKSNTAWVEVGATLGEVYYRISEKSKTLGFPAGICPTVGVGGHISGGGYGTMIRKYGLSVDNVVDANIVDANGKLLDRKSMSEDLFWAIRGGGGGSFGVIISFKISLVPVPETVTVFRVQKTLEENGTADFVFKFQSVAQAIDSNLFMRMLIQPVTSKIKEGTKTIRVTIMALYLGNADTVVGLLSKELPELGLKKENCTETSWINSVLFWANMENATSPDVLLDRELNTAGFLKRKSDYVQNPIPRTELDKIFEKMKLGKTGLVWNPYGGKMAEIPASDTPFPHRKGNLFKMQYSVNWEEPGEAAEQKYLSEARELYSFMTPYVSKNPRGAFLNYRDLDIGVQGGGNSYEEGKVYGHKYFNENFDRLVKVKTAVDPENFFRHEQSIPTLPKKK